MGSVFMGKGELGTIELVYGSGVGVPVNMPDLEMWVRELPLSLREMLAWGPVSEDVVHAHPCCTVCRMVDKADSQGRKLAPVELLNGFHAQAHTEVDGPLHPDDALGSYLRCLLIYMTAGWDGVHRVPDVCLACVSCLRYYPIEHTDFDAGSDCCGVPFMVVEFEGEGEAQRIVWAGG